MKIPSVFFVGIGGVSMSALAKICLKRGYQVFGSDLTKSPETSALCALGAKVYIGHKAEYMRPVDFVVYTGAASLQTPELIRAKEMRLFILKRSDFLGRLSAEYKKVVSVAGCHGKTTTVSMLAHCLRKTKPTVHVGGIMQPSKENVMCGNHKLFITEACEFQRSMLAIKPFINVITNIDADHLDCYQDLADIQKTFKQFAYQTHPKGFLIYNGDDANSKILDDAPVQKIKFGLGNKNDISARNIQSTQQGMQYDLYIHSKKMQTVQLFIHGTYNVLNSLACYGTLIALGKQKYFQKMGTFQNAKRRFELVGELNGARIIHDYAHHPTEITAVLRAARDVCKGRMIAVFEPHTYTRTQSLFSAFCDCFKDCDDVVILPTYAARERELPGAAGEDLAKAIQSAKYMPDFTALNLYLQKELKENDVCLLLGAGTIGTFKLKFA